MSSFGTATTVERIDQIGPGEPSPGLVFRASRRQCLPGLPFVAWGPALETVLRVDDQGLTARGNFGGTRQGTLHLPWSRIQELHYAPSGEGEIGGLYACEGAWCSRCILPRLTETQADEVIAVIADYYPAITPSAYEGANDPPAPRTSRRPHVDTGWKPRWNPAIQPPR